MRNPLRSEAEAFRFLLIVGAGAGAVIAVALLITPLAGAILGLVLVVAGAWAIWRDWHRSRSA